MWVTDDEKVMLEEPGSIPIVFRRNLSWALDQVLISNLFVS